MICKVCFRYVVMPLFFLLSVFALSGCGEVLTGCKDGDPLLFFSPVRDFACPEESTDAAGAVSVDAATGTTTQVRLEWNNPAQSDLRSIEVRWNVADSVASAPSTIANTETPIDVNDIRNGIMRIPNARPSARMQRVFDLPQDTQRLYRFSVSAIDAHGNVSPVRQVAYINAPLLQIASIIIDNDGARRVELSWSAIEGVTYYNVYRADGSAFGDPPPLVEKITAAEYTDTDNIGAESRYQYSIRAVITDDGKTDGNVLALSGYSDVLRAIRGLPAPNNIVATPSYNTITDQNQIALSWDAVRGATKYRIFRRVGGVGEFRQHAEVTEPNYIDMNLFARTSYQYRISTFDTQSQEGEQSPLIATQTVPAAPVALSASSATDSIRIMWNAPSFGSTRLYAVYRAEGTNTNNLTRLTGDNHIDATNYTDNSAMVGRTYTYTVRSVDENNTESANSNAATYTLLSSVQTVTVVKEYGYPKLEWDDVMGATEYHIYRASNGGTATRLMDTIPATVTESTYTDYTAGYYTNYSYSVQPVNASEMGMRSAASSPPTYLRLDDDGDGLIDIWNLNMLRNIEYNTTGTSYKTSTGGTGIGCGDDGMTDCAGYELMRTLDFNAPDSYAGNSSHFRDMLWRANNNDLALATNAGWPEVTLNSVFDGNGNRIVNLYMKPSLSDESLIGFFDFIGSRGSVRNLHLARAYISPTGRRPVGMAAAETAILAGTLDGGGYVIATGVGGTVSAGGGASGLIGGLVGANKGTIIASYSIATVQQGEAGANSVIGGLVGRNTGSIIASYAVGSVVGNAGFQESVSLGGLVGQSSSGSIVASYANTPVTGTGGGSTRTGSLVGQSSGTTVTASYGFGTITNGGSAGHNGSAKPSGVTALGDLTAPGTASTTAVPSTWNSSANSTAGAWDFSTSASMPVLRYSDYDGAGGTYQCSQFPPNKCNTPIPALIPLNVVATSVATGLDLNWNVVAGATTYEVDRAVGNTTSSRLATTTNHSYRDRTAVLGTDYTYTVRALDASGMELARSNPQSIQHAALPARWQSIRVNEHLNSVYYANATWVAVGDDGAIITSRNGSSWTKRTSATTADLHAVYYANGIWVAVGDGGTIVTSRNGISWTKRTSTTTAHLYVVHYADGIWIAAGAGGAIVNSSTGTSWVQDIPTSDFTNFPYVSIAYHDGAWLLTTNVTFIRVLTNRGGSWSARTVMVSGTSPHLFIAYLGDAWFLISRTVNGGIYTSTDNRATWTRTRYDPRLNDISYGGGAWVVIGPGGTISGSVNRTQWVQRRATGVTQDLNSVHYGNGTWVIVADGLILVSAL